MAPGKQGFYNLGNGDGYSVREVIATCEKVTGKKIPTVEKPRRPGDPPRLVASAEKAKRDFAWKPKYPKLEQIVSTAWNGIATILAATRANFLTERSLFQDLQTVRTFSLAPHALTVLLSYDSQ